MVAMVVLLGSWNGNNKVKCCLFTAQNVVERACFFAADCHFKIPRNTPQTEQNDGHFAEEI